VRAVVKRLAARKEELARRAVERFRDEIRGPESSPFYASRRWVVMCGLGVGPL
jgi:hypothetical protein